MNSRTAQKRTSARMSFCFTKDRDKDSFIAYIHGMRTHFDNTLIGSGLLDQ